MKIFAIVSVLSLLSLATVRELQESDEAFLLALQSIRTKSNAYRRTDESGSHRRRGDGRRRSDDSRRRRRTTTATTTTPTTQTREDPCLSQDAFTVPTSREDSCLAKDASIVVIGGGPAGIHMASELMQRGFTKVVVLEKNLEENRFGKSESVTLSATGDVPHELGTCYLAPSYINVRQLFKKYVGDDATQIPGKDQYNKLMVQSPSLSPATLSLMQWLALNEGEGEDPKTFHYKFAGEIEDYKRKHEQIFGENGAYSLVPQPRNRYKKRWINKSFYDYMIEHGFRNLLDYTAMGLGSYGFGFDIPALYGLMILTPASLENALDEDPEKIPFIEVARDGWSNLWKQIVKQEKIDLRRGHEVTEVRETGEGIKVTVNSDEVLFADEVIFATPVNKDMTRNILESPSPLECEIARHLHYVGVNVGLYKTDKRVLQVLQPDQSQKESPDQALVFMPEVTQRSFTANPSGEVYAERNDVLAYRPETDSHLDRSYIMTYQHFTSGDFDEAQANDMAKQQVGGGAEFVVGRAYKDYMPHFDLAAIDNDLPWEIMDSQGAENKWYIGSSVVFEAVEAVVAYNKQLLARASTIFCPLDVE